MAQRISAKPDKATVALAKVNDRRMHQRDVDNAVRNAIDLIGGFNAYVKPGQIVAIKPNQTLWKLDTDGSTTSPRMLTSLIKMSKEAGAKEVWVIEAAGHAQSTRKVMSITGLASAVKEARAFMIYLDEVAHCIIDFGEDAPVRYMPVADALERVDVFIDCPRI